eukprot:357828-Chlamydomonas_euryale.AAC.3
MPARASPHSGTAELAVPAAAAPSPPPRLPLGGRRPDVVLRSATESVLPAALLEKVFRSGRRHTRRKASLPPFLFLAFFCFKPRERPEAPARTHTTSQAVASTRTGLGGLRRKTNNWGPAGARARARLGRVRVWGRKRSIGNQSRLDLAGVGVWMAGPTRATKARPDLPEWCPRAWTCGVRRCCLCAGGFGVTRPSGRLERGKDGVSDVFLAWLRLLSPSQQQRQQQQPRWRGRQRQRRPCTAALRRPRVRCICGAQRRNRHGGGGAVAVGWHSQRQQLCQVRTQVASARAFGTLPTPNDANALRDPRRLARSATRETGRGLCLGAGCRAVVRCLALPRAEEDTCAASAHAPLRPPRRPRVQPNLKQTDRVRRGRDGTRGRAALWVGGSPTALGLCVSWQDGTGVCWHGMLPFGDVSAAPWAHAPRTVPPRALGARGNAPLQLWLWRLKYLSRAATLGEGPVDVVEGAPLTPASPSFPAFYAYEATPCSGRAASRQLTSAAAAARALRREHRLPTERAHPLNWLAGPACLMTAVTSSGGHSGCTGACRSRSCMVTARCAFSCGLGHSLGHRLNQQHSGSGR